jgi:hypothetical protein
MTAATRRGTNAARGDSDGGLGVIGRVDSLRLKLKGFLAAIVNSDQPGPSLDRSGDLNYGSSALGRRTPSRSAHGGGPRCAVHRATSIEQQL